MDNLEKKTDDKKTKGRPISKLTILEENIYEFIIDTMVKIHDYFRPRMESRK